LQERAAVAGKALEEVLSRDGLATAQAAPQGQPAQGALPGGGGLQEGGEEVFRGKLAGSAGQEAAAAGQPLDFTLRAQELRQAWFAGPDPDEWIGHENWPGRFLLDQVKSRISNDLCLRLTRMRGRGILVHWLAGFS
jgi:hypothetical protein